MDLAVACVERGEEEYIERRGLACVSSCNYSPVYNCCGATGQSLKRARFLSLNQKSDAFNCCGATAQWQRDVRLNRRPKLLRCDVEGGMQSESLPLGHACMERLDGRVAQRTPCMERLDCANDM